MPPEDDDLFADEFGFSEGTDFDALESEGFQEFDPDSQGEDELEPIEGFDLSGDGGTGEDDADPYSDLDDDLNEDHGPGFFEPTPEWEDAVVAAALKGDAERLWSLVSSDDDAQQALAIAKVIERDDHAEAVRTLGEIGFDLTAIDDEATPLCVAAEYGRLECANVLLAAGVDPFDPDTDSGMSALEHAAEQGRNEMVTLFIEHASPEYPEVLADASIVAAENGYRSTVDLLGVTENADEYAEMLDEFESKRSTIGQPSGRAVDLALFRAIEREDLKGVQAALEQGANANVVGIESQRPLHSIRYSEHSADLAKTLLDAGAEVNAFDWEGQTPVEAALIDGDLDRLRVLVAAGADPNLHDPENESPIGSAMTYGLPEAVKVLAEAGADLEGMSLDEAISIASENDFRDDEHDSGDLLSGMMEMMEGLGVDSEMMNTMREGFAQQMENISSGNMGDIGNSLSGLLGNLRNRVQQAAEQFGDAPTSTPGDISIVDLEELDVSPDDLEYFATQTEVLLDLGFTELGHYFVPELNVPFIGFVNADENLYASINHIGMFGAWVDLVAIYEDGMIFTASSLDPGMEIPEPPDLPKVRMPGVGADALHQVCLGHQNQRSDLERIELTTDPEAFKRHFIESYTRDMRWRRENGLA